MDASVVCYQLGYSRYGTLIYLCIFNFGTILGEHHHYYIGAIANRNTFIENVWPVFLTNVSCTGNEATLLQCSYSTEPISACNQRSDASVLCQSKCSILISSYTKAEQ